jgi:hypothetical protein
MLERTRSGAWGVVYAGPTTWLPFEIHTETVPMFDRRALQRPGIRESVIPPDSTFD